jgi:hypothetical protein
MYTYRTAYIYLYILLTPDSGTLPDITPAQASITATILQAVLGYKAISTLLFWIQFPPQQLMAGRLNAPRAAVNELCSAALSRYALPAPSVASPVPCTGNPAFMPTLTIQPPRIFTVRLIAICGLTRSSHSYLHRSHRSRVTLFFLLAKITLVVAIN